jgi:putative thioredoxin
MRSSESFRQTLSVKEKQMATTAATSAYVIDVTDQTFATEVLERSKTVPVVVDFWAAWCGPCRMLGPILERLANEYQGQFILAKIDVDQNQRTAMQFRVQGIPAVKAFRDGRLANEFTGALPEPQVRRFIEGLLPSEVDLLVQKARAQETSGKLELAEENYRAALGQKADHYKAQVGLGRTLLKLDRLDEGLAVLEKVPPGAAERTTADALIATAQFRRHAAGQSEADLRARVEANPADVASRYALANLLAAEERYPEALDHFLEVVRRDRKYEDDGGRKAMLALFTLIGEDQEITRGYRQKLANVLF